MADERHNVQSRNLAEYTDDFLRMLPVRVKDAQEEFEAEGISPAVARSMALGYILGRSHRTGTSPAFVHTLTELCANPPAPPLYLRGNV